jgi:hypothetical protein
MVLAGAGARRATASWPMCELQNIEDRHHGRLDERLRGAAR